LALGVNDLHIHLRRASPAARQRGCRQAAFRCHRCRSQSPWT